jgi:uncharacterized protein (TIGR03435 family)
MQQVRPGGTLHLEGNGTTMSAFADMLTNLSQLTGGSSVQVVDMSGLQGHYNVAIDFSLADLLKIAQAVGVNIPANPGGGGAPGGLAASDPGASSSVGDAVKALGLKLESRKAPIEQLVVDQAEKMPTNN